MQDGGQSGKLPLQKLTRWGSECETNWSQSNTPGVWHTMLNLLLGSTLLVYWYFPIEGSTALFPKKGIVFERFLCFHSLFPRLDFSWRGLLPTVCLCHCKAISSFTFLGSLSFPFRGAGLSLLVKYRFLGWHGPLLLCACIFSFWLVVSEGRSAVSFETSDRCTI